MLCEAAPEKTTKSQQREKRRKFQGPTLRAPQRMATVKSKSRSDLNLRVRHPPLIQSAYAFLLTVVSSWDLSARSNDVSRSNGSRLSCSTLLYPGANAKTSRKIPTRSSNGVRTIAMEMNIKSRYPQCQTSKGEPNRLARRVAAVPAHRRSRS